MCRSLDHNFCGTFLIQLASLDHRDGRLVVSNAPIYFYTRKIISGDVYVYDYLLGWSVISWLVSKNKRTFNAIYFICRDIFNIQAYSFTCCRDIFNIQSYSFTCCRDIFNIQSYSFTCCRDIFNIQSYSFIGVVFFIKL